MDKLEKVIKGINMCLSEKSCNSMECPYKQEGFETCIDSLKTEVLELLKEKDNPWRFFNFRQATEEEKEYYKVEYGDDEANDLEMIENVPGDGEEVLLWTGYGFTVDTYDDGMFDGVGEVEKGMAWRYLPEPPKDGEQE